MLGLGWLGGRSTPQAARCKGQPLCVPLPSNVPLTHPGCLVVLGSLPAVGAGGAGKVPLPIIPR